MVTRFSYKKRKEMGHAVFKELLKKVWGLDGDHDQRRVCSEAYISHYRTSLQVNSQLASIQSRPCDFTTVIGLVELVKSNPSLSIGNLTFAIQQAYSGWSNLTLDYDAAQCLLQFTLRLWLFSEPPINDTSQSVADANSQYYEPSGTNQTHYLADTKLLSADFSAKSLTRKGGFYLVWTSDLAKHLTFASKGQLRVFRHARILEKYQAGPERHLYPSGLLEETHRTIHLLFPFEDLKTSKRVRRICSKEHVDIEAPLNLEKAMEEHDQYQIGSYRFYGTRLAEIQRRYDLARPRRLQQWWYDRRQRPEWAALMVALIVFVLTVVFGVIQTITGVLQVYASYRSPR